MDELKKQAAELGIKVDGRWSEERLQAEIDEKLAADPEPEVIPQPDAEPVVEAPAVLEDPVVDPEPVVEPEAVVDPVEPEPEPEPEPEVDADADEVEFVIIQNLQANPMKSLGLASYGEARLTELQMADARFAAKVKRAVELGLIKVNA